LELELRVEKNPSIADNQVAEVTVWTKGPTLRVTEASTDMKASIDQLTEKLLRQVEHVRGKRKGRQVRGNGVPWGGSMSSQDEEESGPQIVKTKQFHDEADERPKRPRCSSSSSVTTSSSFAARTPSRSTSSIAAEAAATA